MRLFQCQLSYKCKLQSRNELLGCVTSSSPQKTLVIVVSLYDFLNNPGQKHDFCYEPIASGVVRLDESSHRLLPNAALG